MANFEPRADQEVIDAIANFELGAPTPGNVAMDIALENFSLTVAEGLIANFRKLAGDESGAPVGLWAGEVEQLFDHIPESDDDTDAQFAAAGMASGVVGSQHFYAVIGVFFVAIDERPSDGESVATSDEGDAELAGDEN